jgi:uncharacterized protein
MAYPFKSSLPKAAGIFAALLVLFLAASPDAKPASPIDRWPAKPSHYVTDQAGMVDDSTEHTLNGALQELEQKTRIQALVVTVNSLEGLSKEQFALELAEHWRLGQKGEDNGFLFLVSKSDRLYRFEVGYGLEGMLPDSYLGTVGRQVFIPAMRAGDSSLAIAKTMYTVASRVAFQSGVTLNGVPESMGISKNGQPRKIKKDGDWHFLLFVLFFVFIAPLFSLRRRNGVRSWRGAGYRAGGFGVFGGGFGGGGGGGFGGFGGGGGGGFGGGGAGGGW